MHLAPSHSGEMSQGSGMPDVHRNPVTDPVARRSKRAMNTLTMSAVGLEFGVSVVLGYFVGHWLDGKAGTAPWLMVAFIGLGFAAGLISTIRSVKRAEQKLEEDERDA